MHLSDGAFASLDLNLVRALHALLVERHVTRAAERLGLTQSATSHALARLRAHLRDPLLVRTGKGMVPSPRAQAMLEPLEQALASIAALVATPSPFEPAKARDRFTLATADYMEFVLLPKLAPRIWSEAPGIDLRVVPGPASIPGALAEGKVDTVLGLPLLEVPDHRLDGARGLIVQSLFRERFVCVMRKGHPSARRRLDLDTFASLPHALISPRGDRGSIVDTALQKVGRRRRVAIEIPHFLVAPYVVQETDVVLTLAERVAKTFVPSLNLVMVKPPLELPGFTMTMLWHEHKRMDLAHAWLRARIIEVSKGI
ncbi:LysR family transcriptional regulator [Pendulispora albinea]|uniref:LysR family transcriptional regulator n=1 Tax=Pendulispora albinea TaxID=2741071 RepID=A0ABZ2M0H8_9BACT